MSSRQKLILGISCLFLIIMTLTAVVLRGTPTYAQNQDNSMQLALHQTFFGMQVIGGLPALALLTHQASTPQQAIAEASTTASAMTASVTHAASNIAHTVTIASAEQPSTLPKTASSTSATTTTATNTPIYPTPTPTTTPSKPTPILPHPIASSTLPTNNGGNQHGHGSHHGG